MGGGSPVILILLGLGCADPELDPIRKALVAWEEGRAALEAGRPSEAESRFKEAAAADPDSPVLAAWTARAREEAGDLPGAIALLDAGIARTPDDPTLRFNRACLRARMGDASAAAEDLRFLYARDLLDATEAGSDPDLQILAGDPATAGLVPRPTVVVEARPESGSVLLGEAWTLEMEIESPVGAPLRISLEGEPGGLLQLERVVEDQLRADGRTTTRRLTVSWTAVRAGRASNGPWRLEAGAATGLVAASEVEVVALPGRAEGVAEPTSEIPVPSAWLPQDELPWVGEADGWLVVIVPREADLRATDSTGRSVRPGRRYELRELGQTRWVAGLWPCGQQVEAQVTQTGGSLKSHRCRDTR